MQHRTAFRAVVVSMALALPALAGTNQNIAPAPGGFLQTGAFPSACGCVARPGGDIATILSPGPDFHEQTFAAGGSGTAASQYVTPQMSLTGNGTAELGSLKGIAHRFSPDASVFSVGVVNGGWNERFTVSHPAHNGQQGVLVFQVKVKGSMHASGVTGSTSFQTTIYKDGQQVDLSPLFNRGNSDAVGTGVQYAVWGISIGGGTATRDIDGTVTYAVPFTFGTQFKLGVYGVITAGQRSSGGVGASSSSDADFSTDGMTWQGITGIYWNGNPIQGSSVVSASGTDWSGPVSGCPADFNGDGFVDFFDFQDFVDCFEGVACPAGKTADFNGDGFPDFFDFQDYVDAFAAGC